MPQEPRCRPLLLGPVDNQVVQTTYKKQKRLQCKPKLQKHQLLF